MKSLVFDSSTLISLSMNNLLEILIPLKSKFGGEFYITPAVKREVVDVPISGKRYKLEAIQVLSLLTNNTLSVHHNKDIEKMTETLLRLANNLFLSGDNPITIVQKAEIECLALAKFINASAFVVDERTTRLLIEDPTKISKILQEKIHKNIKINNENLELLRKEVKGINIIRSTELMTIAFEFGLLNKYSMKDVKNILDHPVDIKKTLLDATLWGLKTRGCSISEQEINEILSLERY